MADKHTFGCGELLPGFGPGSTSEPPPPTITEPPVFRKTPPPVCQSCEEKWTCIQPNPTVAGNCIKGPIGLFSSKAQCEEECKGSGGGGGGQTILRWTCLLPPIGQYGQGECFSGPTGQYATKGECLAKCKKPPPPTTGAGRGTPTGPSTPGGGGGSIKWKCYDNGICSSGTTGSYASEEDCLDSEECNSYDCVEKVCEKAGGFGLYSSLESCKDVCKKKYFCKAVGATGQTTSNTECTEDPNGVFDDPNCNGTCKTGQGPGQKPPPTTEPPPGPGGLAGGPGGPGTGPGTTPNSGGTPPVPNPGPATPGMKGGVNYICVGEGTPTAECFPNFDPAIPGASTKDLCEVACIKTSNYRCELVGPAGQSSTKVQCVEDPLGPYPSLGACEDVCKQKKIGGGDPPPESLTLGRARMGRGLAGGVAQIANVTFNTAKSLLKYSMGGAIESFGVLKNSISERNQVFEVTETTQGEKTFIDINSLQRRIKPGELDTVDVDLYMFGRPVQTDSNDFRSNVEYLEVLANQVHRSVDQLLKIGNSTSDWNNFLSYELTDEHLLQSLNREFIQDLLALKYASGVPVPLEQSLGIIRTVLYSNELGSFNRGAIQQSASFIKESLIVEKSSDGHLNELAALSILEQKMVTLNYEKNPGRGGEILKNVQPIPYDLALAVPIIVNGVTQHYPVEESGQLITGEDYQVDDGDVINIVYPSGTKKALLRSERNHAYVVGSEYRELALTLLGETEFKTLEASSNVSANVEFNYSLNLSGEDARRDFYVLTGIPSSFEMTFKGDHIVETKGRFGLIADDATTIDRLNEFYLKYKSNYMAAFIHYDDHIIDHMLAASSVTYAEKDVVFIQGGDKTNPNVPLLVRGYPKYIIIFPTDKAEYQNFSSKSVITQFGPSVVNRSLPLITTINKKFREKNFVDIQMTDTDVYGVPNNQARKMQLNPSGPQFDLGYKKPAEVHRRNKTGTRVFYEIIQELKNNYVLHNNALIPFDIFSRMTLLEYNKFVFLEGGMSVYNTARDGFFGPRIIEPIRGTIQHNIRTSLKNRLINSPADVYTTIKSTNLTREFILPPVSKATVAKKTPTKPSINQFR